MNSSPWREVMFIIVAVINLKYAHLVWFEKGITKIISKKIKFILKVKIISKIYYKLFLIK